MDQKRYEHLITDDFNTQRDEIGTLLYKLDDKKVSGIPFITDCAWV